MAFGQSNGLAGRGTEESGHTDCPAHSPRASAPSGLKPFPHGLTGPLPVSRTSLLWVSRSREQRAVPGLSPSLTDSCSDAGAPASRQLLCGEILPSPHGGAPAARPVVWSAGSEGPRVCGPHAQYCVPFAPPSAPCRALGGRRPEEACLPPAAEGGAHACGPQRPSQGLPRTTPTLGQTSGSSDFRRAVRGCPRPHPLAAALRPAGRPPPPRPSRLWFLRGLPLHNLPNPRKQVHVNIFPTCPH